MKSRGNSTSAKSSRAAPNTDDSGPKQGTSRSAVKIATDSCPQYKPLLGKCFYLDLPFSKKAENLEKDVKKLGGAVEKFFSKEIKYLVTNKREARYVHCLGANASVPSPDSGHSSPHPGSRKGSPKGSSQGLVDTVVASRGKSLVEKVIKERKQIQMNRILSNALEWGVKILYIDDIISYIEKKKRDAFTQSNSTNPAVKNNAKTGATERRFVKYEAGRISRPFVKVEDSSRHYKPIYLSVSRLPEINFTTAPPCSPFYVEDNVKDGHEKKLKEYRNRGRRADGEEGVKPPKAKRKAPEVREKKRGGYCECCVVKYDNVKAHLKTEQHTVFAKTDQYGVVDQVISEMAFHFSQSEKQKKREKCSLSSVLRTMLAENEASVREECPLVDMVEECPLVVRVEESVKEECPLVDRVEESVREQCPLVDRVEESVREQCPLVDRVEESVGEECTFGNRVKAWSPWDPTTENSVSHGVDVVAELRRAKRSGTKGRSTEIPQSSLSPQKTGKLTAVLQGALEKIPRSNTLNATDTCTLEINLGLKGRKLKTQRTCHGGSFAEELFCSVATKSLETTSSQLAVTASRNRTRCVVVGRKRNLHARNVIMEGRPILDTSSSSSSPARGEHCAPVGGLRRKVSNVRRRRKVGQRTGGPSPKRTDHLNSSHTDLWRLFESSEDVGSEFKGFVD